MRSLRPLLCAALVPLAAACPSPAPIEPTPESWEDIIPRPNEVVLAAGAFRLGSDTEVHVDSPDGEATRIALTLAGWLGELTARRIPVRQGAGSSGILLVLDEEGSDLEDEGYEIEVSELCASIRARTAAGLFYGTQTFRQMLPPKPQPGGALSVTAGTVRDAPRFEWRGLMIDVARHFFSADTLRRYVDVMALYKMNRLHLHLTDDQGWRIEIEAWPSLTEIGGSAGVGGSPGGFYTQAEFAALVEYAAERFVTIVPEIDMPGHTHAALASVPELNCDGVAPELYTGTSVGISSLCVGLPITEQFVRDVIAEVASLTPGPYLHIGGDEAHQTSESDYVEFMAMAREIVESFGKRLVAWEEVGLAEPGPRSIVQHWRAKDLAEQAAGKGASILLSPAFRTYLDMRYDFDTPPDVGTFWAGFVDVGTAYDWDPSEWLPGLAEERIVGIEAAVWTESIATVEDLDFMVFPRLVGLAEVAWSAQGDRDLDEYLTRLGGHAGRLRSMGVGFFEAPEVDWRR